MAAEIYKPTADILARVNKTVAKVTSTFKRHTISESARGSVYITQHANHRMNEREIPRELVEMAVKYGHKINTHKYLLKYSDIPVDVRETIDHPTRSKYDSILPVVVIMQRTAASAGAFSSNTNYTMKTCYRVGDGTDNNRPGHQISWSDRRSNNKRNRAIRDALYRMSGGAPCIVFKTNKAMDRFIDRAVSFARRNAKN